MAAYVARYGSDPILSWEHRPLTHLFEAYDAVAEIIRAENGHADE
jgi:hypothetical protein